MTRERKQPAIRKPLIDEETALRFAAAPSELQSKAPSDAVSAGKKSGKARTVDKTGQSVVLTLTLPAETYARITREAARKERTVEELLRRHLVKHYGKD